MKDAEPCATRTTDQWYKNNPLAQGRGLGIVLHEKEGKWIVAAILRESPAEHAGIKTGDVLMQLDQCDLSGSDSSELISLVRWRIEKNRYEAVVRRDESDCHITMKPNSMRRIFHRHFRQGGGLTGFCRSCKFCYADVAGWVECGLSDTTDRCRGPCAIA